MTTCPRCGQPTLAQSMRADVCLNDQCDYVERYEDAYADEDPGGDFPDSERLR